MEQELLTLLVHFSSSPVFSGVRIAGSLVTCVVFCRSLYVFLSFFFRPLYFLTLFELRLLISPFGIIKLFFLSILGKTINYGLFFTAAGLSLILDPMVKMFQNASSLKPLGQLKPNCTEMIIGRSSTMFMFLMSIGNPRWPPPQYID